ncbi:type I methionyl aminopeptidase [bacterium E08(2017)]|nr:type I methionyl aminopeptidase [bacterium E08(2017)]
MIIVKNADEISRMRVSGKIAAEVLDEVARACVPGVTTAELGEIGMVQIKARGAESAFLGYKGFPGKICVSVNDAVVHGIPDSRRIEIGDIVGLDVGIIYDGFMGDTARTVKVGVTDPETLRLTAVTEQALEAGIAQAVHGNRLYDISAAIQEVVEGAGFSVVRDFVGHGIGRSLHEDPQIPNFGQKGKGQVLRTGMTFCLEPMVNMGVAEVDIQPDGWTVLTRDRQPSAHFEHMVAVGKGKAEVLTRL